MKSAMIFLALIALAWAAAPSAGQTPVVEDDDGTLFWDLDRAPPSDAELCDFISLGLGGGHCPR